MSPDISYLGTASVQISGAVPQTEESQLSNRTGLTSDSPAVQRMLSAGDQQFLKVWVTENGLQSTVAVFHANKPREFGSVGGMTGSLIFNGFERGFIGGNNWRTGGKSGPLATRMADATPDTR